MTEPPLLTPPSRSRGRARGRRYRNGRAVYRRAGLRPYSLALILAAIVALAAAKALSGSDGAASHPPRTTAQAGGARGQRRTAGSPANEAPSEAPTAASLAMHARSSRLGLALGTPPLTLTPAGRGQAIAVGFHHPPRAGLVFDLDTGKVLWQRNATRILPVASLTKLMTALLVARAEPADARVPITRNAVNATGSKVGLLPRGKRVPLTPLLYGLLLPSGNDAAIALAEAVSGSVGRFVAKMNDEAAQLGLGCTRFASPDGLDDRDSSCAVDLAELAAADMGQPRLRPIFASASAVVRFPIKGGKLYLYNNNPLLRYGYPGATGMKTGETDAAGLCLVGTAERHGVRLGVVLLHSPELGRQAEYLLSRAFGRVYHQRPIPAPPVPRGR
jgi:serine-type D-Ala-D-Ala carboxypeptidase (penicillin-binding protein 5/6)